MIHYDPNSSSSVIYLDHGKETDILVEFLNLKQNSSPFANPWAQPFLKKRFQF